MISVNNDLFFDMVIKSGFLIIIFFSISITIVLSRSVVKYNETEARLLLNIAAGAYSSNPEPCINK